VIGGAVFLPIFGMVCMTRILNRMFVAAAVVSAVSLIGASVPANAQRGQDKKQEEKKQGPEAKKPQPPRQEGAPRQKDKPQRQAPAERQAPPQRQARPQRQAPPQRQAQPQRQAPQPRQQAQPREARPQPQPQPQQRPQRAPQARQLGPQIGQPSQPAQPGETARRLPEPQQQQLIGQQRQRLVQYGAQLDQQTRLAPQQAVQLQQQHRPAQYAFQQQYIAGLREQQQVVQGARNYNYGGDPYFYTAPTYRYYRAGHSYQTNDYGATVLRDAVNAGYREGFEAGRADRQDHWPFNYRTSYAYRDGIYGYRGFYIDRTDYIYYFREGFRRGYSDGYYGRHQYGASSSGRYSILGAVLSTIVNLQRIR
jgi:hypothetical protein